MRWAPVISFVLLTWQCTSSGIPEEVETAAAYNILWITAEDLSPRLGCYGDTLARTPHIDRLAEEGIRYTNVYSVSGVCAPSRAAIITGLYPTSFGAQHMRTMTRTASLDQITDPALLAIPTYEAVPPPAVKCFPEYLRAAGYYCTNNAKTDYQFAPPITAWDESSNQAHWRNRSPGQPFFAVFNIGITHESQVWARADEPLTVDPEAVPLPPYYPDTEIVRRDMARHYSNIALMDERVGAILSALETDGLLDSTIVFFYTDHGDGLPRAKRWPYDSGLRVPLIVRFPDGAGAGSVRDELVSFVDLAPTVLSLARIPLPDYLHGRAFLGEQRNDPPSYVFAARDRMDPAMDNQRAVRDRRYKYIRNYMPERPYVQFLPYRDQMPLMQELLRLHETGGLDSIQSRWFRSTKPLEELYDTQADPWEVHNLAGDPAYADKLAELRAAHEAWKSQYDPYHLMPEEDLIKQLWPPDGEQPQTAPPQRTQNDDGKWVFSCPTAGASIAWRPAGAERWQLYTGPLDVTSDSIEVQAVRIGYRPSGRMLIPLGDR